MKKKNLNIFSKQYESNELAHAFPNMKVTKLINEIS